MRRRIVTASIALALGALALGAGVPAALAQGGEPAADEGVGLLFTQTAKRGALKPVQGERRFALKLEGVAPQVVWFEDRPDRQTGQIPVGGFVRSWAGFGFEAVPPNAALTLLDADNDEDTVILKLGEPRYRKSERSVRYPVRILDEATGNLSHHEPQRDDRVPGRFRAASLFIDDASAPVVNGCVIQPHTDCVGVNLAGADLSGADLTGASLENAYLYKTDFSGANLSGAGLSGATIGEADLSSANLTGAYLNETQLAGANLSGADLTGASLIGASLGGANLSNANLTNASLVAASLFGVDLTGAKVCNTTWTDDSVKNWSC